MKEEQRFWADDGGKKVELPGRRDCSGYLVLGFSGQAVKLDEVLKCFVPRPGVNKVDIGIPDAMVVGRCGDCVHWSDIGEYNSDSTICVSKKCSVGIADADFGCIEWEGRED